MPQNDRHKEREIPIEFDFYNTLESLPVDNRCTIIMISCGSTTVKINEHIQTVTAPAVLCISQYDNFQCLERTHLSAKVFHFDPWYIKACLNFENLDDSVPIDKQYVYDRNMLYMFTKHLYSFIFITCKVADGSGRWIRLESWAQPRRLFFSSLNGNESKVVLTKPIPKS